MGKGRISGITAAWQVVSEVHRYLDAAIMRALCILKVSDAYLHVMIRYIHTCKKAPNR